MIGKLDERYVGSASDRYGWVWYLVSVGGILGGMTGAALACFRANKIRTAGILSLCFWLLQIPLVLYTWDVI